MRPLGGLRGLAEKTTRSTIDSAFRAVGLDITQLQLLRRTAAREQPPRDGPAESAHTYNRHLQLFHTVGARHGPILVRGRSRSKNRRSHTNMRGPFRNGHFEISGHPHRKLFEPEALR